MAGSPSEADLHARASAVFVRASDLPDSEREAYVAVECGGDEVLRTLVQRLLEGDRAADGFLGATTRDGSQSVPLGGLRPGFRVGAYSLIRELGRGGMGVVWLAERVDAAFEQRVAIKFLTRGAWSEVARARFHRERQVLADLQHPNIARILDGGEDTEGRPYVAMEFIDGEPIGGYCDAQRLSVDERIELFLQVCDAVEHAHQRLVIHRDLKPQNVLVEPGGRPYLLDFGIAKVLSDGECPERTRTEDQAMTPQYASPEQVRGEPLTVASDVYSLGLLLYELLAGRRPYELQGLSILEAAEVVCEAPTDRPSTVVLGTSRAQDHVERCRMDAAHLSKRLSGDLDTILLKAVHKDLDRRYPTVAAFTEDLRRHLAGRPVSARPDTVLYRVDRFVRRNPALSGSLLAVVLVTLVAFALVMARAEAERKRADEVFRLALGQDLERLIDRTDELWPPHPDRVGDLEGWVLEARALVAELPELKQIRDAIAAESLPVAPGLSVQRLFAHPRYPDLVELRKRIDAHALALAVRRGERQVEPPDVDWSRYPEDPSLLNKEVVRRVSPNRTYFGEEALALALAQRAVELARQEGIEGTKLGSYLTWRAYAHYALGQDDLARASYEEAILGVPDEQREDFYHAMVRPLYRLLKLSSEPDELEATEAAIDDLEDQYARMERRLRGRIELRFPADLETETRASWWHRESSLLIDSIEELEDPKYGLLAEDAIHPEHGWSVSKRLRMARHLQAASDAGGDHRVRWDRALPSIREAYADLEIGRQSGLVPLGPDPESGLWEFWHVPSGAEPVRGEGGSLKVGRETGLVFVLLPGGRFWMGAQSFDPDGTNFDPKAGGEVGPVHVVELSAYFLSKYEMTQAQWLRLTGENPSTWAPHPHQIAGRRMRFVHEFVLTQPVETVSWHNCMRVLGRFGLDLPTEAQWEYGARGGTQTSWWTGDERESLRTMRAANLADRKGAKLGNMPEAAAWPELDDGHATHAPVDTFAPNPYGLHHVHGNVAEWCLDSYQLEFYRDSPLRDPRSPRSGRYGKIVRGGSYDRAAEFLTSWRRGTSEPSVTRSQVGLRPARAVER